MIRGNKGLLLGSICLLVLAVPFAWAATGDVEQLNIKTQKCLADFQGERVVMNIDYRGNLISGKGLEILDITAATSDGQQGGMLQVDVFSPSDNYQPRGLVGKLRRHFRLPFMKRVSDKYLGKVEQAKEFMGGQELTLEESEDVLDNQIPVDGLGGSVYLPEAFVSLRDNGTLGGFIQKDADNDGITNLFDNEPFFFSDPEDDLEDELEEKAEEQLQDQAKDQAQKTLERRARLDEELRRRQSGELQKSRFSAKARVQKMPDVDVWRKDFQNVLKRAAAESKRQSLFSVLAAKPALIVPFAAATAALADAASSEDDGGIVGGLRGGQQIIGGSMRDIGGSIVGR